MSWTQRFDFRALLLGASSALLLAPTLAQDLEIAGPLAPTWSHSWGPTVPALDRGLALVQSDSLVWLAGSSGLYEDGANAPVRCLSLADGQEQWVNALDLEDRVEAIEALALSADEQELYAAGLSRKSAADQTALFARLDAQTGELVWLVSWDALFGESDFAADLVLSQDGSTLFATGTTEEGGVPSDRSQLFVLALDSATGQVLWSLEDGPSSFGSASARGEGLALSPDGSTLYVGAAWHVVGDKDNFDVQARAHDPQSGALLWSVQAIVAGPDEVGEREVLLDPTGKRLFIGARDATGAETFAFHTPTGSLIWGADLGDEVAGLAASANGQELYALMRDDTPTSKEARLLRIQASSGLPLWSQGFDAGEGTGELPIGLSLLGGGQVLVGALLTVGGGSSWVVGWDAATGAELWRTALGPTAQIDLEALGQAPSGAPLALVGTGTPNPTWEFDLYGAAIDPAGGSPLWVDAYGQEGQAQPYVLDARILGDGRLASIGRAGSVTSEPFVSVRGPRGEEPLFSHLAPGGFSSYFWELEASPDEATLFVAGERDGDFLLEARDSTSGSLEWSLQWNGPGSTSDRVRQLSRSPAGDRLYAAGESELGSAAPQSFAVHSLDARNGQLLWSDFEDDQNPYGYHVDVESDSERAYALRRRLLPGAGEVAETVAYDSQDGTRLWSDLVDSSSSSAPFQDDEPVDLALSPSGARVYVLTRRVNSASQPLAAVGVRALDSATGAVLYDALWTSDASAAWPSELVVSPDGTRLYLGVAELGVVGAASDDQERVLAFDASTGSLVWEVVVRPHDSLFDRALLALDPSGSELLLLTQAHREPPNSNGSELHLSGLAAADGELLFEVWDELEANTLRAYALAWSPDATRIRYAMTSTDSNGAALRAQELEHAALFADVDSVSVSSGGLQKLRLRPGLEHVGETHFVLGSLSGPGVGPPLGGGLSLPFAVDAYTRLIVLDAAASPVQGAVGLIGPNGQAQASVVVPPNSDPALAGLSLQHAYVSLDSGVPRFVSDPVPLSLTP